MPSRIIREGILTSERINKLSIGAELFYRRLMSVVDDYGRYFAHPSILRAACFPLKVDEIKESDVKKWLGECNDAKLVTIYNGDKYLQIVDFNQKTRTKSKFPQPADILPAKCPQDAGKMPSLGGGVCEGEDGFVCEGVSVGGEPVVEVVETETLTTWKTESGKIAEIFEEWNKLEGMTHAVQLSDKRRHMISARLKEPFFVENWRAAMTRCQQSAFCRGQNNRGWKADIEWFARQDVVARIMEGKYDDRKPSAQPSNGEITAQTIAWRKELDAVTRELKELGKPSDYAKGCANFNRATALTKSRDELRTKLGVTA